MLPLQQLARPNIWTLPVHPLSYMTANPDVTTIKLHTNESPYNTPYNRVLTRNEQSEIRTLVARLKGVSEQQMLLGTTKELIADAFLRTFCDPGKDNVVTTTPSDGLFRYLADMNNVKCKEVVLYNDFDLNVSQILAACDRNTKLIWLSSPGEPSGKALKREKVEKVLQTFQGLVVVDETYADFSRETPWRLQTSSIDNLVVIDTFDKVWANAGVPISMAFARHDIVELVGKVCIPFFPDKLACKHLTEMVADKTQVNEWISWIVTERQRMVAAFALLPCCEEVFSSTANFFLARMTDASSIEQYLRTQGIAVYNCSHLPLCDNCLRITVGTKGENTALLAALRKLG